MRAGGEVDKPDSEAERNVGYQEWFVTLSPLSFQKLTFFLRLATYNAPASFKRSVLEHLTWDDLATSVPSALTSLSSPTDSPSSSTA